MATKNNQRIKLTNDFSLADIGSPIVDQLSKDIYSHGGAVLSELIKNGYDAYQHLPPGTLEEEGIEREISIQRSSLPDGSRILSITDYGIGQDFTDLRKFIQIGKSDKPEQIDGATGFRGLGSWSTMGVGSKIRITTSKLDVPKQFSLTIDVQKIYQKLSAAVGLDQILNDDKLVLFEEEEHTAGDHFTTVEIICSGPSKSVNNYQINRLWEYADPAGLDLKSTLVKFCSIPFLTENGAHPKIKELYSKINYTSTPIRLGTELLYRSLPKGMSEPEVQPIKVDGQTVAWAWSSFYPDRSQDLSSVFPLADYNLPGSSLQITRLNVPIGEPGLFYAQSRSAPRQFVGEICLVSPDLLPNAGGNDLRECELRPRFRRASRYLSPHSCSQLLNRVVVRMLPDDGVALGVESDGADGRPITCFS